MQSFTGHMGYANNVSHDLFGKTSRAISVIVALTVSDHDAVANVVTNTATITTQLRETLSAITNIWSRLDALELVNGTPTGGTNNTNTSTRNRTHGGGPNNEFYCYTHGRTRRTDHVSDTYRNPAEGHIASATLHNHQGGSNYYCGGGA